MAPLIRFGRFDIQLVSIFGLYSLFIPQFARNYIPGGNGPGAGNCRTGLFLCFFAFPWIGDGDRVRGETGKSVLHDRRNWNIPGWGRVGSVFVPISGSGV